MDKPKFSTLQIQGVTAESFIEQIKAVIKETTPTTKPQPKEVLLTRKEVAKLLKISLVTVHTWTKQGILKPYRIGNQVRYKETEVLQALTNASPKNL